MLLSVGWACRSQDVRLQLQFDIFIIVIVWHVLVVLPDHCRLEIGFRLVVEYLADLQHCMRSNFLLLHWGVSEKFVDIFGWGWLRVEGVVI